MPGELLLDTGALVSLLDRSQTHHLKCRRAFADRTGPLVSTEAVLTEATHLLAAVQGGRAACVDFFLAGGALLDDDKKGALELYLSRSVTRWSYLSGKVLAVLQGHNHHNDYRDIAGIHYCTLAAMVDHINRTRPKHILTLEDPIEYRHTNRRSLVTQREVERHTPSFAQGLKAALREDPDIIMVGEMRDAETMSLAISAAATGQLVFGTLHTLSAAQTVDRILDSFDGERQTQVRMMLAESLKGVLAQRLIRRANGSGRVLALEILAGNSTVAALIRDKKTFQLPSVIQTSRREGMQSMDDAILTLVRGGVVTAEDAADHLSSPDLLSAGPARPGDAGLRKAA